MKLENPRKFSGLKMWYSVYGSTCTVHVYELGFRCSLVYQPITFQIVHAHMETRQLFRKNGLVHKTRGEGEAAQYTCIHVYTVRSYMKENK